MTNHILLVRPANFGYNEETAVNNAYQRAPKDKDADSIANMALDEFDLLVAQLKEAGVDVHIWNDKTAKPDAVFPNNWFATLPEGQLFTFPMFAPSRREERDPALIDYIEEQFIIDNRYEMEQYEERDQFLEGTGSLVLDHDSKIAYACISSRTDIALVDTFSMLTGYKMVAFHAANRDGMPVYHTNVIMAVLDRHVLYSPAMIQNEEERKTVTASIRSSGKTAMPLTEDQINAFAGNMIQLKNWDGEQLVVLSKQASDSLLPKEINQLEQNGKLITTSIPTIERYGGGSVRCMIAEIFLRPRPAIAE